MHPTTLLINKELTMKLLANFTWCAFVIFIGCRCSQGDTIPYYNVGSPKQINYLALGDSYTIGQSVCTTCRFPEQLKARLQSTYPDNPFLLQVIAKTGWTTTNLLSEVNLVNPSTNFDLVTLLIGVNNQYQNRPIAIYQAEFPQLVTKAIAFAKGDKKNVIVVSIPDYAFTPFGQGAANITTAIDQYNAIAKNYCDDNGITFVNITDITRSGLVRPELVASDGLHPSELAYSKFVDRILPKALLSLGD
jgi:lysophospholipase L1-like esterase